MDLAKFQYLAGTSTRDAERPVIAGDRQQVVDLLHGKHYIDALRGRLFSQATTPLGLALPIYTATAATGGSLPILNQAGSNVLVELVSVDCNRASGTADFGAIGLMAGFCSGIGTATGCSAFAAVPPMNGQLGLAGGSKVISSNAGTVTVTAGVATAPVNGVVGAGWIRSLFSFNLEADTGTAHANFPCHYDFDGSVIVPPGMIVYLAATKASVALMASTLVWKEYPLN